MSVKFRVAQAFNFSQNSYVVVFNTANPSASNTVTPEAAAVNTGFAGYSMAIAVGQTGGSITAQAFSYFRPNVNTPYPVLYPIGATQQNLQFFNNSNGLGTEWTVIFNRNIAYFNAAATPTPSPGASTSPTPSPSVSPSPTAVPTGVTVTQYWTYNFFIVSGQLQSSESGQNAIVQDSLGQNAGIDQTYSSLVLNVDTSFDTGSFYTTPQSAPYSGQDAITGGEIANNSGTSSSPSPTSSSSASPTSSPT